LEANSVIVYISCVIFLFLIGKFFILPLKTILKIIGNSVLGGLLIFIVNIIGSFFNFHIGLNVGTALITGILGVPRCNTTDNFKNIFRIIFLGTEKKRQGDGEDVLGFSQKPKTSSPSPCLFFSVPLSFFRFIL